MSIGSTVILYVLQQEFYVSKNVLLIQMDINIKEKFCYMPIYIYARLFYLFYSFSHHESNAFNHSQAFNSRPMLNYGRSCRGYWCYSDRCYFVSWQSRWIFENGRRLTMR